MGRTAENPGCRDGHRGRTKVDWAHEVAQLLDTRYAKTPRITLVCDNLNTHRMGAFYEAFPPEKARIKLKRLYPKI